MKSYLTFSRWLLSLLLVAFVWSGAALAQSKPAKPDQDELSAIEETAAVVTQGQLNPNRSLRSPVCPTGNLSEGFEDAVFPPEGWKVINAGDANTWIRYTSSAIAGSASASIAYSSTAHNDWLIAPRVVPQAGNSDFSFWAKNGSSSWIDRFNVKLSTTGTEQADFTVTLAANVGPPTTATLYTYDLSAYNGQPVYVAIQAISSNQLRLYVDDFSGPELYGFIPPYFASATSVDFGVTYDMGSYSMDYEIKNCSAGDLELDFLSSSPEVSIMGLPLTVATGATGTITVNFDPAADGAYAGNFQLTTNDPENPILEAAVASDVQEAIVTASIYENFDSYVGYSGPVIWTGNFSTRTTGGVGNSVRYTRNLYGTGSFSAGQFATNFVDMADDGVLSFYYRAVNYSSYPNNPTPAASFEFTVYISTDFGVTFTPIYVCDATTHTASTDYAFVELDVSAYSGETAMFVMNAERFDSDFWLDFDEFSVSFVEPGLEFLVDEVLMGDRPIGAWMKHAELGIMNNPGRGSFTFTAADIDNNFGGFLSAATPELPFVLEEGESTDAFGIRTNSLELTPGAYTGSLALFYEPTSTRAAAVIPFSGNAYLPVDGDVWETAIDPNALTFPITVPKGAFRDNYDMPGANDDGWDVVYELDVNGGDVLLDITLTADDAKMAIYPAGFGGIGGPDMGNELYSATTSVTNLALYEGMYYLVVSTTGANFTLDVVDVAMPAPAAVTNLTPTDGAVDIENGDELTWSWGANTLDYRVVLGTTYPPATVVQDWATANTATDGSFTLSGLNPNLQYFWRVDVSNNNGTTNGDVWGFTTTISSPTGLEVVVNDPGESSTTVSASLTWDNPMGRALIGYNVYKDGVNITPTPITSESYTDLTLARNTTYSYYVTAVFDEGESAASNTVSVTTQGVGTFNGFVFDALTNDPIEGAIVKITGDAGVYTETTTANGAYSTLAYQGTYNLTVNAVDYNPQALSNLSLTHGATLSRDFYMSETPYPVAEVVAFELNENSTQISWSGTAPNPLELVKITQNPGLPENAYYQLYDMGYGVVYDLLAYPDATINSMNFHHASWGTYGTWQYKIHVYNWDTKTLIGTYGPYSTTGNDKWETGVNLGNVSAGGAGLVAIIMEPLSNSSTDAFPDLSSDNDEFNPQGSIYGFLNNPAGMSTSTIGNFLMELYIYTAQGARESVPRYVDFGEAVNAPNRMNTTAEASKSVIEQSSVSITKGEETYSNRTVPGPSYADGTRGIVSYDVWREKVYQAGTLEHIGNTFSEDFVDFDWGNMDWGVYRWGVTVNYDAGQVSARTFSNTLDKDMEIAVDVAVALNSGESPGGTSVTFANMSEPDIELVYNVTLDNSGTFEWDEFRRGIYDIEVMLPGYGIVQQMGFEIFEDASFTWLLEELLTAPADLYVTPTAYATWGAGAGGGGSFVPMVQDFNEGLGDWTVEHTNTVQTWGIRESATQTIDGTPYAYVRWTSNPQNELLVSPVMDASAASSLYIQFEQYYRNLSGSDIGTVEVYDGSAWVTAATYQGQSYGSWTASDLQNIDVTAYKNDNFQVRFRYIAHNDWYWAIDNVKITNAAAPLRVPVIGKGLEHNKVFLDGQLITETTDSEYQYDVSMLTPYETYTAGVIAVYATGVSPMMEFDFIYVPCGDYDVPTAFAAAQVEGTLDIMLEWTNVDAAALDTVSALRIYRNGEEYAELNFEDAAVETYLDANLDFGMYTYCVTYIYDSGAETCQGLTCSDEVEIDGNAGVDGMVMQAAYLGGDPIEAASVLLVNVDNPATTFEFFTDATGAYEGMIIAGTYDYTVSAAGYTPEMLEGVEIVLNATVTNDFELMEFPSPPINVVATEITDDNVLITWHNPTYAPFEPVFETFDNGIPSSWTVVVGGSTADTWYMETPAGNPQSTGASLDGTNFAHVDSDEAGSGASLNEMLYTPVVNASTAEALFLSFDQYYRHLGSSFGKVEVYDGTAWVTILNQTATAGAWSNPNHQVIDVTAYANEEFQVRFHYSDGTSWSWYWSLDNVAITDAVTRSGQPVLTNTHAADRSLFGYEVYRTTCETGDLQFLGLTLDTLFNDNTWGTVPSGMYKWGVVALYDEDNTSETVFSNCLDKDMITAVSVTVNTNSGDSPEGTNVLFTNTSEPGLELTYETQLDETGYFAWEEFRKGIYDIYVEKNGFASIEIADYPIDGPEDFDWMLEELLLPVSDLYVTPTGFATWRGGGVIPFEPFIENFDGLANGQIPEGWTKSPETAHWGAANTNVAGGTAPEMKFYYSPTYTGELALMSPSMSTIGQTELTLSFNAYLWHYSSSYPYSVKVVAIADGVEYIIEEWSPVTANIPAGLFTYDLTAAQGVGASDFKIAWIFYGNTFGIFNWNIDDVMLYTPGSRELQNYKVWLDGVYKTDTPETFHQYDVTNLVEGQEYLAEVAAVYSNGISAKMSYLWTYYSCENYPGPENLAGSASGQDVTLTWGSAPPPPPPPGDGFEDDFEGHANFLIDFAPWTNVDVDGSATYGMTGITWPNAYAAQSFIVFNPSATSPALTGADAHSGNKYAACFASVTAPNNDWLMSPLVPVGTGTTVSFWAKSFTADYGLERFKVGVSTTGLNPADFTIISPGSFVEAPATAWTEFSYDLSAYAGQEVYVGINCVSNDAFFLMIDDFTVGAAAASFAFNPPSSEVGSGTKAIGESVAAIDRHNNSEMDANADIRTVAISREMWDLQFSFDMDTPSGLTGLAGAETDGVFIYAPRWAGSEIVKFDVDGNFIETFSIPGVSGLRDLAFDGTYMYGAAAATTVFKMDFTNKTLVSSFTAPTAVRAIAYDDDLNAFWGNNWSTDMVLFTEAGVTLNTLSGMPSMYGAAYDNFSEGGPYLWFFTGTTTGGGCQVEQYDIAGGALTGVSHSVSAALGDVIAGGLYISDVLIPDKVIIGGTAQGTPDLAFAFELMDNSGGGGGGGGDFDTGELLGANVYRDGLLIAEMVTDTFYVDPGVDYGTYTYCVHYVYESGAESCSESCVDVEVTFPCDPPKQLAGQYLWTEEAWGSMIEWNGPQDAIAEWLFYDNGVNVDGIGGPATFIWAVKFDPAQLADLGGASLTKIMIYNRTSATDELRIYEGTNAATLLHSQPLSGLGLEVYEEVDLTSSVLLDVTKQLWIAVYTTDGVNYPAGVSNYAGNPNSDLITQDGGATWEHLNTLGLPYSWNLRGFVTTVAGATAALPMDKPVDQTSNTGESIAAIGKPGAQTFFPDATSDREVRELESFNVYRSLSDNNYELIASVPFEDGITAYSYFDTDVSAQVGYYYQVTAFYSYTNGTCESTPAMSLETPEDDFVYVFVTSTSEFTLNNTRVYPNPANNNVVIESAKMNRVTVMSALGQVVLDRAIEGQIRHDLNTSTYEAGIYLIRIETTEGVVTKRLTIVR